MADNAAVASLLEILNRRAQQPQQQQSSQHQQQPQPPLAAASQANPLQLDPRIAALLAQQSQQQQLPAASQPATQQPSVTSANTLLQLAAAVAAAQQQQSQGVALVPQSNTTAGALAALAAAYNGLGASNNAVSASPAQPQPTNTGFLDLNKLFSAESKDSVTIGEYYGRPRNDRGHGGRSFSDGQDPQAPSGPRDRGRDFANRDRLDRLERGGGGGGGGSSSNFRQSRRSQTPPRLRDEERYRSCSPKREPSPGGTVTESMIVKTVFVGLIIGRGGETLKRIETQSGARIQFITNGKEGPERVCNISGRPDQIVIAKRLVLEMIETAILDSRGRPLQNGTGR
ncbi:uncharacterized protein V1518DRAFT_417946 [Limtongia smithiae]|uniref:uncharacterized protein n=1 Tax=Limtongia smithiae TaxID=1125753 RepID=UPI0034CFE8D7